jgi:hypothetical protein
LCQNSGDIASTGEESIGVKGYGQTEHVPNTSISNSSSDESM